MYSRSLKGKLGRPALPGGAAPRPARPQGGVVPWVPGAPAAPRGAAEGADDHARPRPPCELLSAPGARPGVGAALNRLSRSSEL